MRSCLVLCLSFIILLGIVAVIVLVLIGSMPGMAANLTPIAYSQQASISLEEKASQFERALTEQSGSPAHLSIQFTEQEITSKVAELLKTNEALPSADIRDIQVHFLQDKIIIVAQVGWQGINGTAAIAATAYVASGKPIVEFQTMELGALPMPGPLADQIKNTIDESLRQAMENLDISIENISIQPGLLTITGTAKRA